MPITFTWTLILWAAFGLWQADPTQRLEWTEDPHFAHFIPNLAANTVSLEYNISTLIKCADICSSNRECSSFFYGHRVQSCYIMTTVIALKEVLFHGAGFAYYRLGTEHCPVSQCYYLFRTTNFCLKLHSNSQVNFTTGESLCEHSAGRYIIMKTPEELVMSPSETYIYQSQQVLTFLGANTFYTFRPCRDCVGKVVCDLKAKQPSLTCINRKVACGCRSVCKMCQRYNRPLEFALFLGAKRDAGNARVVWLDGRPVPRPSPHDLEYGFFADWNPKAPDVEEYMALRDDGWIMVSRDSNASYVICEKSQSKTRAAIARGSLHEAEWWPVAGLVVVLSLCGLGLG